jgi:hypothetical protein
MPCACQVPVPLYPETAEWGPILWLILHGLAEKAGSATIPMDEILEWPRFLKLTGEMLPCDICSKHFATYLSENPIPRKIPYDQLRDFLRTWLWTLHNDINEANSKPIFLFADLTSTYSSVDIQDQIWRLTPVMKRVIELSGVSLLKWTKWLHSCKLLKSILGI